MKFAALALTLLLAVGSHGDAWPGQVVRDNLPRLQEAGERVLQSLVGTEYEQNLPDLRQRLGVVVATIDSFLQSGEVKSFYDSAKERSDQLYNRWQGSDVRTTILKRTEEYKNLFTQFYDSNQEGLDGLKMKLMETIGRNHEHTVNILREAAIALFEDAKVHVENLKEMAKPYADEYVEQIRTAVAEAQGSPLRETIAPKVAEIRMKVMEIYGDILNEMNKQ